jgi:hypothetical protein
LSQTALLVKKTKKFKKIFSRLFSFALCDIYTSHIKSSLHHHHGGLGSGRFVAERRRRRRQNAEKTLARAFETDRGFGKSREKGRFGDEFSSLGKVFFLSLRRK